MCGPTTTVLQIFNRVYAIMHTLKTCLPAQAIEHHHHTSLHTVAVARTINRHNQSTLIQLLPISPDLRECYTTVFRLNKMCSSKLPTQVWQHGRDQSAREKGIWVLGVSIWCGEMGLGMGEITLRGAGGGTATNLHPLLLPLGTFNALARQGDEQWTVLSWRLSKRNYFNYVIFL